CPGAGQRETHADADRIAALGERSGKETESDNQRGAKAAQRVAAKIHNRFLSFNTSRNGNASRSGSVAAMLYGAEKCILPQSRRTDFVWHVCTARDEITRLES